MEQQRNYIFLWHGFDEGDTDIQLGVHTAKEYNTMYEKSGLARLSHVRSDLFPFRSCIKGQPRFLVAVPWWLCHPMGDGMADSETTTRHTLPLSVLK